MKVPFGLATSGLALLVLAHDEVVDHARAQRARTVQRHQRDDVLEAVALELFFQVLGRARFGLEHRGRVAVGEQAVHRRIVERQILQAEILHAGMALHEAHRLGEDGQRAQAEEVELHQADRLDVVLVELRHHRVRTLRTVQWAEIGEPARRDQHAAGVHADVARQFLELRRQPEEFLHFLFLVVTLLQLRLHLQRLRQRHRLHALDRHQLGQLVAVKVGHVEHAADVTDHRFRAQRAEGGDLRHRGVAVFVLHVLDHAIAPVLAEIDVEVGHRHPLGVEKALEQQVVAQGVEVGDRQAVGNQRAGAGAAPRSHRHAVVLGPVDEVRHDQEVARKTHLNNDAEFEFQALGVFRQPGRAFGRVRVEMRHAFGETLVRTLADVVVETHAVRRRKIGQTALAQFQREVAALGDFDAVGERLRQVGEQLGHLVRRFEVLLGGERPRAARVAEHHALGNTHACLVRPEIVRGEELDRMGGHRRQTERGADVEQAVDQVFGVRLAEALQFQVIASRKQRGPGLGGGTRGVGLVVEQGLRDVAGIAARQGDEPVAALGEPGRIDLGAAAIQVFLVGAGKQFAQAAISFAVLRQQQEPRRPVAVGGVAQPHVAAEYRFHALATRRVVELDPAESVGKVGQAERRHARLARPRHRIPHPHQAVGDGKFTMQAEVDEARGGHGAAAEKQGTILTRRG